MREMLALQPRFDNIRGKRAMNLVEHKRFRAAYDFMLLRAEAGEVSDEIAKFWTDIQLQSPEARAVSFQLQASPDKKPQSRRRRRRKPPQGS
jgi:poly(A) polymerase